MKLKWNAIQETRTHRKWKGTGSSRPEGSEGDDAVLWPADGVGRLDLGER